MATRRKSPPLGAVLALLTLTAVDGEFTKIMDGFNWQLIMKLSKNDFCYGSSRWTDGNAHNANYMNGKTEIPPALRLTSAVAILSFFFLSLFVFC